MGSPSHAGPLLGFTAKTSMNSPRRSNNYFFSAGLSWPKLTSARFAVEVSNAFLSLFSVNLSSSPSFNDNLCDELLESLNTESTSVIICYLSKLLTGWTVATATTRCKCKSTDVMLTTLHCKRVPWFHHCAPRGIPSSPHFLDRSGLYDSLTCLRLRPLNEGIYHNTCASRNYHVPRWA